MWTGGHPKTDLRLIVTREPNVLGQLAIEFSAIFREFGIEHAFVAGYVAILSGPARSTEDIDVILERCSAETIEQLAERQVVEGF